MEPDRVASFTTEPAHTLASLETSVSALRNASLPPGTIVSAGLDIPDNGLVVGTENPSAAKEAVVEALGPNVALIVRSEEGPHELAEWVRNTGQLLAGDYIALPQGGGKYKACSAGCGVYAPLAFGRRHYFLLTAAHCGIIGTEVLRSGTKGVPPLGTVARRGRDVSLTGSATDADAIDLANQSYAPEKINIGSVAPGAGTVKDVRSMPSPGRTRLCHAGAALEAAVCGKIVAPGEAEFPGLAGNGRKEILTCFHADIHEGDSGGPVWIEGTHSAVGLATEGRHEIAPELFSETCAVSLEPGPSAPNNSAVLTNLALGNLQLRTYEP
jgi:hypothetical protein